MKKSVLWGIIALATATMSSCSNDEPVEALQQNNAIEFGTYLGRDAQGRGVELNGTNLADFGVFAAYTGQSKWATTSPMNFMFDQKVEKVGTDWKYSPKKYWPTTKNDKITFFAYAPYKGKTNGAISVASTNTSKGTPQITYTINPTYLTEAEDFTADVLYDEEKDGDRTSIDSKDRTVKFTLKHELTRVSIQAKLDRDAYTGNGTDETYVNIKKIEFAGTDFATVGTYTFAASETVRGTWSHDTKAVALDIDNLLNTTTQIEGTYNQEGVKIINTTAVSLLKDTQYLFLIPEATTGLSTGKKVTITVSYDIVTKDAALNGGHSCTPAVKTFTLPAGSLKQGKAYNYILTFGLNELKLSAIVAFWEDDTPSPGENFNVDWTLLQ